MKHYAPHHNKMYVLKYIAHGMREQVFEEVINGKKDLKNKAKAQNWMNAVIGKYHIKEMNESEVVHLISELYCKMTTGHSLKTILSGGKPKPIFKHWRKIIKMPMTKLALFFGVMEYK